MGGSGSGRSASRHRLDVTLVELGLAESRAAAQRLVMAGDVRVDGQLALKASQVVGLEQRLEVVARSSFVSRGGEKLAAALSAFGLAPERLVCADVGASTGGFTDCLLQRDAARVYAIDVGHGILHWRLRQDPRVVVLERTNARNLVGLPEPVTLVTVDVAFISLRHILPMVAGWLIPGGHLIALIKPQFEAGRGAVGKGGVVRDPVVHRRVLVDVVGFCRAAALVPQGVIRSPLRGPKGNVEFLLWAVAGGEAKPLEAAIDRAVDSSGERPAAVDPTGAP
jgi:23S rRNA (cytidine1920-2'-O)/16S rRNA (cytidine1409-2'-O)-methyltransferase